ncbi:MAG TPA: hypothetical protein EYP69_06365 [Bacteroidales bacterium]|nr:hypothetical protein [Bacteroidales bacterium]
MINKITYFLEKLWLVFAIVSMGMAIYRHYRFGLKESYALYIIAIISIGMFFTRYSIRKKSK